MDKIKRRNYLINKPFQLGFIFRYLLVILASVILCFAGFAIYYFQDSLLGISKLNQNIEITKKGYVTTSGFENKGPIVYEYVRGIKTYEDGTYKEDGTPNVVEEDDVIEVCKEIDNSGNITYKEVSRSFIGSTVYYKIEEEITDIDPTKLTKKEGQVKKMTKMFFIIIGPLGIMCLAIMIIISIYSIFFSHRMAGPIFSMNRSLDEMLKGKLDCRIGVRDTDFFQDLAGKLKDLRQKIVNNEFATGKGSYDKTELNEIKEMVSKGASKEDIINKIDKLIKK